jgi:hypothetical protein
MKAMVNATVRHSRSARRGGDQSANRLTKEANQPIIRCLPVAFPGTDRYMASL